MRAGKPGDKIARKAFNGMCGLRGGVGAAGRLALEGKLGEERKKRELSHKTFRAPGA